MTHSIFSPTDQENSDRKIALALERIAQAQKTLVREASKESGLSPIQIQFLIILLHERHTWSVGSLAHRCSLTPATVSDAITCLETKKLLARKRSRDDKREVIITLTDAGKATARRLAGWANALEGAAHALPDTDKATVLAFLTSFLHQLQQAGNIGITHMCPCCCYFREQAHPETSSPHHCMLLDRPVGPGQLRLDCPHFREGVA